MKADSEALDRVHGTPVYPGTVLGRACVILNLDEISNLQVGDVLITHSTDIGWTPYFPMLGGVVTELGGLISHGLAVVATELGGLISHDEYNKQGYMWWSHNWGGLYLTVSTTSRARYGGYRARGLISHGLDVVDTELESLYHTVSTKSRARYGGYRAGGAYISRCVQQAGLDVVVTELGGLISHGLDVVVTELGGLISHGEYNMQGYMWLSQNWGAYITRDSIACSQALLLLESTACHVLLEPRVLHLSSRQADLISIVLQLAPNRNANPRIPETRKRFHRLKDTTHGTLQGTPTTNIHPRTEVKQTFHARHTTRHTNDEHRTEAEQADRRHQISQISL
uniref:PEP-utilising enzyme mobile domain-containing protein n=1 Tax=Timema cristinae TaxID=61476 RepID=A0A7R9H966_TIMCR|nr:unnamed protein product [Timema cristinae]